MRDPISSGTYYTATRKLFKYIDPYNDPTLIPVQTAMYCINK